MSVFTAAQRRSLERICGNYLNLSAEESNFTLSDVFSLGLLLTQETVSDARRMDLITYYKNAYTSLCGALKISNPELFLIRLANASHTEVWNDFSDFKSVWYPKWFSNQMHLRVQLFDFADEEAQKIAPDFWGETSSEQHVKTTLLAVRDSFKQIRVGALALVFNIDAALATLLGWEAYTGEVSWVTLKEKFSFPRLR